MRTPAHIAAAAHLLAQALHTDTPADKAMDSYFRQNRYIGSKDKKAIAGLVYGTLRHLGAYLYRTGCDLAAADPLVMACLHAKFTDSTPLPTIFDGSKFAPLPFTKKQQTQYDKAMATGTANMPAWAKYGYPAWMDEALHQAYGTDLPHEMAHMLGEAPLDIRCNTLKTTTEKLSAALQKQGIKAALAPFTPWGLRLGERLNLFTLEAFKTGQFEVQDAGSQTLAALCPASDGMRVVDYCAGAGGKSLALAAKMHNKGKLLACDIFEGKLKALRQRATRAGVDTLETHLVPQTGTDSWVKRQKDQADLVLLDVPCTGTGTWRRNPDAKWRLTPEKLANLAETQKHILATAAPMVKKGGWLVYATCSVLPAENDQQVAAFMHTHPGFELVPVPELWRSQGLCGPCPTMAHTLQLHPARDGTDGFFIAVMRRA